MTRTDGSAVAVLLFGPPGSGKGTVSKQLAVRFQIPHISTGDILREQVQKGTGLGREVKAVMEAGKLVSDELMHRIVRERLERDDCRQGLILDGYPRTLDQATVLTGLLAELKLVPVVIYLDVDSAVIVERLTARRSCPACGAVYNLMSLRPKVEGVCDACGAGLVTREDDKEETIRRRLEAYQNQSQPLLDYFSGSLSRFHRLEGGQGSPEEIAARAGELIARA